MPIAAPGGPEAIYTIERLMDRAARELGEDPTELRRKNFIKPESMPYATAAGETYDTGEFAQVMDAAMANADGAGFPARQAAARAAGKRRGIGLCYYIESTMGDGNENAAVRFDDDGMVSILVGTQSTGQGHETAYAQILNDKLGVPLDRIRVIQGDTDLIPTGGGTGGSRSVTAEGWAIQDASDKVIERGKAFASRFLRRRWRISSSATARSASPAPTAPLPSLIWRTRRRPWNPRPRGSKVALTPTLISRSSNGLSPTVATSSRWRSTRKRA